MSSGQRGGGGAMLLKSVSLFLARGRRASACAATARGRTSAGAAPGAGAQGQSAPGAGSGGARAASGESQQQRQSDGRSGRARGRRMGDDKGPSSSKCSPKTMDMLRKRTHFSRQEIEALCRIFRKLLAADGVPGTGTSSSAVMSSSGGSVGGPGGGSGGTVHEGLNRVVFRELLHNTFDLVTEEVLMDRIFCGFDRHNDGVVRLEEWVCGLSVFLRGTLDERSAFCFLVYDLNNDGYLTRDEMFNLLRNCLIQHPGDDDPDEGVRDLVELALKKLDADRDGKVSYADFRASVASEALLLEAFGQCLPSDSACDTFLSTLRLPE